MKYDYLFIDLDGPILDTKNRHFDCFLSALKKFSLELEISKDEFWNKKRFKTSNEEIIGLDKDFDRKSFDDYITQLIEEKKYLEKDTLKPKAEYFLENSRNYF